MDQTATNDRKKELRALVNKMIAFPEQDWTREGRRVAELRALIVGERTLEPHA